MSDSNSSRLRSWFPLFVLALVLVILVIVFASYPKWGAQAGCEKNLRKLALALHDHWDKHGTLPPAYVKGPDGKPAHSWRVAILPFLGRQDLYDAYRFDEPWNGPNNSKLIDQMPEVFCCPAADGKSKKCTSYVAVVGSQTAWPGDRGVKLPVLDGTSNTIMLMEIANSDIPWLEPRDLTMRDLIPWDSDKVGDKFGSPHKDSVTIALCDGSIRTAKKEIKRSMLYSALTAWSGNPYKGEWLPGEERMPVSQFPAEKPASAFPKTSVVPHKFAPVSNDRNAVYCSSFQIAWDDLAQLVGGTPKLDGDSPFAAGLNSSSFPRSALANVAYVALIGLEHDGIRKKITDEMSRKFPNVPVTFARDYHNETFIAYAFLQKNLPFKERFEVLKEPIEFRASGGAATRVRCFGIPKSDSELSDEDAVRYQVKILHYCSDDDFVIQLLPLNDEIVLAKMPPGATLAETLEQSRQRIRDSAGKIKRTKVEYKETLAIPHLAFNILRQYNELIGRKFQNAGWQHAWIAEALQSVRFLLNESGARLESEVQMYGSWNGHSEPPKPRRFVLDKPFLLYLKEKDATEPYLVLWIANAELMHVAQ